MRKFARIPLLFLILLVFAACGDDSNNGPGFAGPDISGTWRGSWGGDEILMVLDQNGASVTGSLSRGSEDFDLTGTVSEVGVFAWGALTPSTTDCISMSSSLDDFAVMNQNTAMQGVARRTSAAGSGDDPCGGRRAVSTGTMTLQRAF